MVGIQFVLEGLVVGLGEHAFFFKDGQDTHRLKYYVFVHYHTCQSSETSIKCFIKHGRILYLLNQLNTGSQVHAEVNELPLDTFLLVLFLLQDKHVVVEKLLESFVGVVDTQLLKAVELFNVGKQLVVLMSFV